MKLKDAGLFRQQCYVDGDWVDAPDGAKIDVTNPASGNLLGTIPALGTASTEAAVAAASAAFPAWAARTAKERGTSLRRWYDLLIEHADDIATLMTAEQGKPLAEARGEVIYAASFIEWFAEEAKRLYGDVIPGHQ
ncbi:MAG TPA: aldehyde dehydrogenase family protein, partial [Gammaproteobacteria bacterium]